MGHVFGHPAQLRTLQIFATLFDRPGNCLRRVSKNARMRSVLAELVTKSFDLRASIRGQMICLFPYVTSGATGHCTDG